MTGSVAEVLAAHAAGEPLVLATSGTSVAPRSVVRSTASWWLSFDAYTDLSGVSAGSRVWVPGPLSATANLFAAVHARVVGATPAPCAADASHSCLTPALLDRHLLDLAPGHRVTVAGDRLTRRLADRVEEAGVSVAHYYGAAELSFVAAGRDETTLLPFPGVEVAVRDGEIWARSPYLALGYVDGHTGPLRRDGPGPDSWATVGDRGSIVDGRLVVHGRPDAVTTGGVTVLLSDVESALSRETEQPVVCFGVPRPSLGEELAAAVASSADRRCAQRVAREALAPAQRPRRWVVVPDLPLTAAGKTDRRALTALAAPAGVGDTMRS